MVFIVSEHLTQSTLRDKRHTYLVPQFWSCGLVTLNDSTIWPGMFLPINVVRPVTAKSESYGN